jgi:hypothetical protein
LDKGTQAQMVHARWPLGIRSPCPCIRHCTVPSLVALRRCRTTPLRAQPPQKPCWTAGLGRFARCGRG